MLRTFEENPNQRQIKRHERTVFVCRLFFRREEACRALLYRCIYTQIKNGDVVESEKSGATASNQLVKLEKEMKGQQRIIGRD